MLATRFRSSNSSKAMHQHRRDAAGSRGASGGSTSATAPLHRTGAPKTSGTRAPSPSQKEATAQSSQGSTNTSTATAGDPLSAEAQHRASSDRSTAASTTVSLLRSIRARSLRSSCAPSPTPLRGLRTATASDTPGRSAQTAAREVSDSSKRCGSRSRWLIRNLAAVTEEAGLVRRVRHPVQSSIGMVSCFHNET